VASGSSIAPLDLVARHGEPTFEIREAPLDLCLEAGI